MSSDQRRSQVLAACKRSWPALTIELARLYLETEPEDRTLWLIYGEALRDLARYGEARSAYERALALSAEAERATAYRLSQFVCLKRNGKAHYRALSRAPLQLNAG